MEDGGEAATRIRLPPFAPAGDVACVRTLLTAQGALLRY